MEFENVHTQQLYIISCTVRTVRSTHNTHEKSEKRKEKREKTESRFLLQKINENCISISVVIVIMNLDTPTSFERSRSADPAPSSDSDGVDTRLFYQQSFALLPAIKSSVFQRKRIDNESRYDEFKELKRSDKFTLNCWNSFCKFARPISPTRDAEKREGESELNIAKLLQAVKLVHSDVKLEDVQKLTSELLWSENEMISWEKFKYFCWELFRKVLQFREHEVHVDEGTLEQSQQSFDVLSRRQKYITSTGLDCLGGSSSQSQLSRVAGTSISSIQKDGVVEVIRRELRENAREGSKASICLIYYLC